MPDDWMGSLHELLQSQAKENQSRDEEFFSVNLPKKEIVMEDETYGVFDIGNEIYWAQKYSNGYHLRNLVRIENILILTINEVIQMRGEL